jgi:penicillin-binding protein 1C
VKFTGKIRKAFRKRRSVTIIVTALLFFAMAFIAFWHSLPDPLFDDPSSTILEDRYGQLIGARIADDGQWRFPLAQEVPDKFRTAICLYEDRHFYRHPGVNPLSIMRALKQNLAEWEVISGGSTITMQVIRLMRQGRPRTVAEKAIEMIISLRLELSYSKDEILALYASHAPFGGNVVGLDAAAWRYFNRPPDQLSWAETATLAVLPNAPSMIHPGKNRSALRIKRDLLLKKLFEQGIIDSLTYVASLPEPLPDKPSPLPSLAPQLLTRVYLENKGERVRTTLDPSLQEKIMGILRNHNKFWADNQVYNAAVLVAEVGTGDVLAYVGNMPVDGPAEHSYEVDIIRSSRSSGSILKPVLFAAMNDAGDILPKTLIPDIPVQMGGFTPKNFSLTYDGVVTAEMALSRSLNIPSVIMLKDYGADRFYTLLKKLGITTINRPADHYGLSLILGGAEVNLWELTGLYAGFSRTLNHFPLRSGKYLSDDFRELNYHFKNKRRDMAKWTDHGIMGAGAIWQTYEALIHVNRPGSLGRWEVFSSMDKIAWKTGTSFGFRDAWAIGTTPGYVVGVWVGNADGEGRPGLTGSSAAAPVMFYIFSLLPGSGWFETPYEELEYVPICRQSGHRIGMHCTDTIYEWVCRKGLQTAPCPYHRLVHLEPSGNYRVGSSCARVTDIQTVPWFCLPPLEEWYFARKHPDYRPLPPFSENCASTEDMAMDFIFPASGSRIYIPKELEGSQGQTIFKLAHRSPESVVYWHLDNDYITTTTGIHQVGLAPEKGIHSITAVDEMGNAVSRSFEVVND